MCIIIRITYHGSLYHPTVVSSKKHEKKQCISIPCTPGSPINNSRIKMLRELIPFLKWLTVGFFKNPFIQLAIGSSTMTSNAVGQVHGLARRVRGVECFPCGLLLSSNS